MWVDTRSSLVHGNTSTILRDSQNWRREKPVFLDRARSDNQLALRLRGDQEAHAAIQPRTAVVIPGDIQGALWHMCMARRGGSSVPFSRFKGFEIRFCVS